MIPLSHGRCAIAALSQNLRLLPINNGQKVRAIVARRMAASAQQRTWLLGKKGRWAEPMALQRQPEGKTSAFLKYKSSPQFKQALPRICNASFCMLPLLSLCCVLIVATRTEQAKKQPPGRAHEQHLLAHPRSPSKPGRVETRTHRAGP